MEDDDKDDIPAFFIEEDMDGFPFNEEITSFLTSKVSDTKKTLEVDEDPNFLEYEYEAIDQVPALETKKKSLHFEPIRCKK